MCAWNVAHPGLSVRNNRRVTFIQSSNSAAHNYKISLRKCLFEYDICRIHAYGAHVRTGKYIIIFIAFL